jgi:hypothetical protein
MLSCPTMSVCEDRSVAREEATAEFVRHYRLMMERTKDNPKELSRAFDEHPDLGPSIKRLGEIVGKVDRHWRTARHRYFSAHPEFGAAIKDFDERWKGPYNEIRDLMHMRAMARISEEFIRNYRLLIARTGDDPSVIERAAELSPEMDGWIDVLREIEGVLRERRQEFEPFLARSPDEFRKALADFRDRWAAALNQRAAALVPI